MMNSEKIKEIKRVLEEDPFNTIKHYKKEGGWIVLSFQKILTLINELESENETKTDTITDLLKKQEFYEKEKLKQFAERLKEQAYDSFGDKVIWYNDIDETLKEFINEEI